MRLPLSLHSRLGLLSIVMVTGLILGNLNFITNVLEGVLADNIDVKLDTNIMVLDKALDSRGQLDLKGLRAFPSLLHPAPGWGWDILTPQGHWHQGLALGTIEYPVPHWHVEDGIYSGRGFAVSGEGVHVRRLDSSRKAGRVSIVMMSPRVQIDRELDRVIVQIYTLAAQIVLLLIVLSVLQIRVGLAPLRRLVDDVARVRSGKASTLPERQPSDLQPLATEINALIERNKAGLATARVHAANLAHAVATPLSSLMLQLEYEGVSQEALELLGRVSNRVAHHLHRARSASGGIEGQQQALVTAVVSDVRATMALVYRARFINISTNVPEDCVVAVDPEDLGEMMGNLIDNACRYAHQRVDVAVDAEGLRVQIVIEDDGPGIPPDKLASVLQPGVRLDEVSKGYGLGLAIVRELAELYGGSLDLGQGPLGGLRAVLDLPR